MILVHHESRLCSHCLFPRNSYSCSLSHISVFVQSMHNMRSLFSPCRPKMYTPLFCSSTTVDKTGYKVTTMNCPGIYLHFFHIEVGVVFKSNDQVLIRAPRNERSPGHKKIPFQFFEEKKSGIYILHLHCQ